MSTWIVILGVAACTFLLRASFIVFADPHRFPKRFRQALTFVPPAVLDAIVLPGLLLHQGAIDLTARRRHVRLPVMVEVRWRRHNATDFSVAALSEISEGGALLLTRNPPAQGEEIIVEIMPPGSERALEVLAVVRNTDNPDGVGLEFLARDMGGVHRLREVIRRLVEQ